MFCSPATQKPSGEGTEAYPTIAEIDAAAIHRAVDKISRLAALNDELRTGIEEAGEEIPPSVGTREEILQELRRVLVEKEDQVQEELMTLRNVLERMAHKAALKDQKVETDTVRH